MATTIKSQWIDDDPNWGLGFPAKGGEGSGNFGHAGRPGERGGSAPSGSGGGEGRAPARGDKKNTPADRGSAAARYNKQKADVASNFTKIKEKLTAHDKTVKTKNWGRVGELGHVDSILNETLSYLGDEVEDSPSYNRLSADQAYAKRSADITRKFKRLTSLVNAHGGSGEINYNHVGDLGYVNGQLRDIADFLGGN